MAVCVDELVPYRTDEMKPAARHLGDRKWCHTDFSSCEAKNRVYYQQQNSDAGAMLEHPPARVNGGESVTVPQSTPARETPQEPIPHGPLAYLVSELLAMRAIDPITGCWLWTGAVDDKGYGRVQVAGKTQRPHRLAAAIWHGLDLSNPKIQSCHDCPGGDNPLCFNPAHLFVGTHTDNMADRRAKGRAPFGARSNRTHLTDTDVAEIRRLRGMGLTCESIGQRFGIGRQAVSRIARGKRWPSL